MEESLKTRIIFILAVLSLICLIGMIGSCSSAFKKGAEYNGEMRLRLDKEEELLKVKREKTACMVEADRLKKALDEEKELSRSLKNELLQEKLVNQNLKEEMQKVARLKERLENELKDSAAGNKTRK
ncbi:MAG: hypothetical protein WC583_03075 [Candidatus Omnitrophota bacterium]|jgi:preprotein translocase subunit SecF|nr:hypothetical protein [Candidatus Omnitrophota bacterium]MDD3982407.1 hypothetical protein [Candidatus Omnitrophota bacterium]MDD5526199.1 hypothetical protein [Candidatus Omnitrophota bacterium]